MYKVMIVDDVEIFRRDFKRLRVWSENPDFIICDEASDGLDALQKLEVNPVDVLFIDIKMPRMDGIELLRNVSERKLCPCVILLSNYTEYGYARQGFIYEAFDYIGKEFGEDEFRKLLTRIRRQLQKIGTEVSERLESYRITEDIYFTESDIKILAQLIGNGDVKAIPLLIDMIETIKKSVPEDRMKALSIIRSIGQDVTMQLYAQYQWLPLFIDIDLLEKLSPANCKDWNDIYHNILEVADEIIAVIHRLIVSHDQPQIKKICEYILINIHEKLSVKLIAEKMYISKPHLSEVFKQKTGTTLLEYITTAKMERAKILLNKENLKLYEIAYQLGYQDNEYFNKVFRRYSGVSLTEYRKTISNIE